MIKTKVIDLLNKIANGEIDKSQKGQKYEFAYGDYCTIEDFIKRYVIDDEVLNCEVEIIEEDKKIEKLEPLQKDWMTLDDIKFTFSNSEMIIVNKINEIIDYLEENKKC